MKLSESTFGDESKVLQLLEEIQLLVKQIVESTESGTIVQTLNAESSYFDACGMYCPGRHVVASTAVHRTELVATPIAVFRENLAHISIRETEVGGSDSNVQDSCTFVQKLIEDIAKMEKRILAALQLPCCTVESIVSKHTNLYRLLSAWRNCWHRLEVMAYQGIESRQHNETNDNCYEWVDQTFEPVETQVSKLIDLLFHNSHRAFFDECVQFLVPVIDEQSWASCKPWFGNTRCTYAVQGFVFRTQMFLEYVKDLVITDTENILDVNEKLYELAARMMLDVLIRFAETYEKLVVSRSREGQWKIDILYLVCGVYKLLKQLNVMLRIRIAGQSVNAVTEIHLVCLRLLVHLAIRSGPVVVVLESLMSKFKADTCGQDTDWDTISELEGHVASIIRSLDPQGVNLKNFETIESERKLYQTHTIFGSVEIKRLIGVELNWTALISRSSMPKHELLSILQKRHERGNWPFPALTDADFQVRCQIEQFLDQTNTESNRNERDKQDLVLEQ